MDFQKFTEKSIATVRRAEEIATEKNNPAIEEAHFLLALLLDGDGLIPELLSGMKIDTASAADEARKIVAAFPKVVSADGRVYASRTLEKMLTGADKIRADMADEYLSVEHLMLSLLESDDKKLNLLRKN